MSDSIEAYTFQFEDLFVSFTLWDDECKFESNIEGFDILESIPELEAYSIWVHYGPPVKNK